MPNCLSCYKYISNGDVCNPCKDRLNDTLNRLNREKTDGSKWTQQNSFCNKLTPRGKTKMTMVILGIIFFLWPIGFYLGLDKDASDILIAILGSVSGLGLISFLAGTLWWCCVDPD